MTNQIWFKTCYSNIEFLYWYSTPIFGWCPPIHHPSMLGCRHTVVGSVSIFMGKKMIFHYTSLSFHGRTEDLPEILCIHLKRFRFDNAYGWSGPRTTGFCDSLVASSIVFFPFRARAEDLASWQLSQPPNRSMLRIPTAWVGDAKNGKPRPCRYSLVIKRGNGTSHIYRWFSPWNTIYSGFFRLPPFITRGDVFFLVSNYVLAVEPRFAGSKNSRVVTFPVVLELSTDLEDLEDLWIPKNHQKNDG